MDHLLGHGYYRDWVRQGEDFAHKVHSETTFGQGALNSYLRWEHLQPSWVQRPGLAEFFAAQQQQAQQSGRVLLSDEFILEAAGDRLLMHLACPGAGILDLVEPPPSFGTRLWQTLGRAVAPGAWGPGERDLCTSVETFQDRCVRILLDGLLTNQVRRGALRAWFDRAEELVEGLASEGAAGIREHQAWGYWCATAEDRQRLRQERCGGSPGALVPFEDSDYDVGEGWADKRRECDRGKGASLTTNGLWLEWLLRGWPIGILAIATAEEWQRQRAAKPTRKWGQPAK